MSVEGLIWKCVTVFACVVVLSVSSCTAYESGVLKDMVAHGADPVGAACAIKPAGIDRAVCLSYLNGKR